MSQLIVDDIINNSEGAPGFSKGLVVTGVCTASIDGNATSSSGLSGTASVNTTGIITASSGNFTGNVSIGGILTYEDVTNVDSVGLITARAGVNVSGGELVVGDIYPPTYEPVSNTQAWIHGDFDGAGTGLQVGNGSGAGSSDESVFIHLAPMSGGKGVLCQSDREGTYSSAAASSASFNLQLNSENSWVERLKITPKGGFLLSNGILVERCAINSTNPWSTTNDVSLDEGNVHLNTNNLAGTNNTIDIISSNTLNVDLAVGDMTSVTLITAVNSTSSYIQSINVDGSTPTISWVGGSAPSDGGGSGYDTYTFNIIKTANATFLAIANQVKGS